MYRNPLKSNEIDGNTLNISYDRINYKDHYECSGCKEIVEEYDWIEEFKVCRQCWEDKHGCGYINQDIAETIIGDR